MSRFSLLVMILLPLTMVNCSGGGKMFLSGSTSNETGVTNIGDTSFSLSSFLDIPYAANLVTPTTSGNLSAGALGIQANLSDDGTSLVSIEDSDDLLDIYPDGTNDLHCSVAGTVHKVLATLASDGDFILCIMKQLSGIDDRLLFSGEDQILQVDVGEGGLIKVKFSASDRQVDGSYHEATAMTCQGETEETLVQTGYTHYGAETNSDGESEYVYEAMHATDDRNGRRVSGQVAVDADGIFIGAKNMTYAFTSNVTGESSDPIIVYGTGEFEQDEDTFSVNGYYVDDSSAIPYGRALSAVAEILNTNEAGATVQMSRIGVGAMKVKGYTDRNGAIAQSTDCINGATKMTEDCDDNSLGAEDVDDDLAIGGQPSMTFTQIYDCTGTPLEITITGAQLAAIEQTCSAHNQLSAGTDSACKYVND